MITQSVSPKKLSPLEGMLLIAAIIAGLFAASLASNWLSSFGQGLWGQLAVWLLTGLCAYFVMRKILVQFQYTISEGVLYIERLFGKSSLIMLSLPISDVRFIGSDAQREYPDARLMLDATIKTCELPIISIAYQSKSNVYIMRFQPDAPLSKALKAALENRDATPSEAASTDSEA